MSSKFMKPLSVAVGVAFVGSLAISQAASASSFALTDLDSGYQLTGDPAAEGEKKADGKCGEGKCGEGKAKEAHCGADKPAHEGKCGEGKCGEAKAEGEKKADGKCGEGKCGEAKAEGDKKADGKCGEGKCGGSA